MCVKRDTLLYTIKGRLHDEAQARWAEVVEAINYRILLPSFGELSVPSIPSK